MVLQHALEAEGAFARAVHAADVLHAFDTTGVDDATGVWAVLVVALVAPRGNKVLQQPGRELLDLRRVGEKARLGRGGHHRRALVALAFRVDARGTLVELGNNPVRPCTETTANAQVIGE